MNEEQIRKDFEEWMGDGGLSQRALERNSVGDYRWMKAAHAWNVWKAACAHYAKPTAPVVWPEPDAFGDENLLRVITPSTIPALPNSLKNTFNTKLYTEAKVRALLANTKRSTNRDDESVGLREALVRAHDWMDSQADSQSKGGHETFDLMMLRAERNAIKSALDESPQPQTAAQDAERYRWLRDEWLGNEPEAINMERARGQRGLDAAIDAAIAAAKGGSNE